MGWKAIYWVIRGDPDHSAKERGWRKRKHLIVWTKIKWNFSNPLFLNYKSRLSFRSIVFKDFPMESDHHRSESISFQLNQKLVVLEAEMWLYRSGRGTMGE
jgi:hypothetical protein